MGGLTLLEEGMEGAGGGMIGESGRRDRGESVFGMKNEF